MYCLAVILKKLFHLLNNIILIFCQKTRANHVSVANSQKRVSREYHRVNKLMIKNTCAVIYCN